MTHLHVATSTWFRRNYEKGILFDLETRFKSIAKTLRLVFYRTIISDHHTHAEYSP
ncbi:hypothetical protein J6590_102745 [Homalodisca vitripennis]|nr:hypothetical protein J6590_102745 [Homalodisca vitripennis]